jgi:hypothetical protein
LWGITSLAKAERDKIQCFEFTTDHPFHEFDAVNYRIQNKRQNCVPVFSWTFIGSTKGFERSMMEEVLLTDPQYRQKEEYAKRFMIVFLPFRTNEDLMENNSYQRKFQTAYKESRFAPEMIEIANNIQAIQNSIESAIPENCMSSRTAMPDMDEFESTDEEAAMGYEDLLSSIGDMFALPGGVRLEADATCLDPDFSGVYMKEARFKPEERAGDVKELFSVIQESAGDFASASAQDGQENPIPERFRTATMELNSLLLRRREHATSEEEAAGVSENEAMAADASGSWNSVVKWGHNAGLDAEQQVAFEVLTATYVLTFYDEAVSNHAVETEVQSMLENKERLMKLARIDPEKGKVPLRMFVTGPAGAGKCKEQIIVGNDLSRMHSDRIPCVSHERFSKLNFFISAKLLEEVVAYAKLFSQNIGHQFTRHTIRMTAMTGAAAMEIGGSTTASEFNLMKDRSSATQEEIDNHKDTRLNIIDEVSFAGYKRGLEKTSSFLQNATECTEFQYGRAAICFLGDFCQLESIDKDVIYKQPYGIYWEQALNCLVELKGTHRYKNCPDMQRIMPGMRQNGLSAADRKVLNSRVIDGDKVKLPYPDAIRKATYYNDKRCSLNMDVFRSYLAKNHAGCTKDDIVDTAIVIKCKASWGKSKVPLSFEQRKVLFEKCSEANVTSSRSKRLDPLLCLVSGCHLMVNDNIDVYNGIANGTTTTFVKAILKKGAILEPMQMFGYWVYSVTVDDVDQLEMEWQDYDRLRGKIRVSDIHGLYNVHFPVSDMGGNEKRAATTMQLTQFPVVVNYATTGHKLQGKSVDELMIAQWSKVKNWAYVVLSRVRTLKGLFLEHPIPDDIDFSPHPEYLDMMERLRNTILVTPIDTAEWN